MMDRLRCGGLCVLALCGTFGVAQGQNTDLDLGRGALARSDFAGALKASYAASAGAEALRLRLDANYYAGDLTAALRAALSLAEASPGDPYGAYMASRLALDLGRVELGQETLEVFWARLEASRPGMAREMVDWYVAKGDELKGQAHSMVEQAEAERSALFRARMVVLLAVLTAAFVGMGWARKDASEPA